MINYIWITFEKEGMHKWPDADKDVVYLKHRHWHIFKFKVSIEVLHNDREIEFHKFRKFVYKDFVEKWPLDLENKSCEMMADDIYEHINNKYPNRKVIIDVSEDGQVGANLSYPKSTHLNTE
jgi:hypothetical protein